MIKKLTILVGVTITIQGNNGDCKWVRAYKNATLLWRFIHGSSLIMANGYPALEIRYLTLWIFLQLLFCWCSENMKRTPARIFEETQLTAESEKTMTLQIFHVSNLIVNVCKFKQAITIFHFLAKKEWIILDKLQRKHVNQKSSGRFNRRLCRNSWALKNKGFLMEVSFEQLYAKKWEKNTLLVLWPPTSKVKSKARFWIYLKFCTK